MRGLCPRLISNKWDLVVKRSIIDEKKIDKEKYTVTHIVFMLKEVKLFSTFTSSKRFDVRIVIEVIANLNENFGNSSSPKFEVFIIKGNEIPITPDMIDVSYGFVVQDVVATEQDQDKIARCLTWNERTWWID